MTFGPDIDPKNGKIDSEIKLGGSPEYLASDGAGKVFINLTNLDQVAAVDLHLRRVIARWPVAPGGSPVGMALDKKDTSTLCGLPQTQAIGGNER